MIRGVIFDIGGVLVDPGNGESNGTRRAWADRLGISVAELEQIVCGSDLSLAAQRGQISLDAFWAAIAARLGLDETTLADLRADFFKDERLNHDLVTLAKELRAQGYRVGALSNAIPGVENKLRDTFGLYTVMDAVVISAHIGAMKPEPEAYRAAAAALRLSLPECVLIDDNTAHVDGARATGMHALLFRPDTDLRAALRPLLDGGPTRALIFDFGNVLDIPQDWEGWRAHREAFAESLGVTGEALAALVFASEAWHQVKVAGIMFEEYLDAVFRPLGISDPAAQRAAFDNYFDGRSVIHPAMRALLHDLKPRFKLALLSNAYQRDMARWLAETHDLNLFDDVISSAEVGLAKPDPAIYRLALERLGVEAGEAIFVDDLARNTEAAESIGLPSLVFESPEQLRRELTERGILS